MTHQSNQSKILYANNLQYGSNYKKNLFLSNIQELKQCNPPQFFYHIIHDHRLRC